MTSQTPTLGDLLTALVEATNDPTMPIQQARLLVALWEYGELDQAEIYKHIGVERTSVSRNIAKLGAGENQLIAPGPGWVENVEDLRNRKRKIVRLTPRGKEMMRGVFARASSPKR